ncbi:MAG TPA: hypothetical protein VM305_08455 [Candidatus Limnocylindrales bacterium]|nr:hypothetical protein [Candidatus Limnocylindrales bacterium]
MTTLDEERREALTEYIAQVRDALNLQAYKIVLRDGPPPGREEATAMIQPVDGRMMAELWLGPSFWIETPEEQRQTIAHEMLHVLHRDATDVIRLGAWIRHVGQGTYDATWEVFRDHIEKMVDRLSVIVAPRLPLPELATAGDTPHVAPLMPHGPVAVDTTQAGSVE